MHPYLAAGAISALLVLAGTALSCVGAAHEDEPVDTATVDAATSHGGGHGSGAHDWTGGAGSIPAQAMSLDRSPEIRIGKDTEFTPAMGVRSGRGTFEDPYVISGWSVDTIYIYDTSAAFEIKENFVSNIMVLDWTGAGGYVHHNHIANLRTNRNVDRTGDPSATVIEKNLILEVEELRHFDGIVRNNTIGREPLLGLVDLTLGDDVVLNIAGLNGAGIHDNTIFGGVDMKIHGHHHSDADGSHSHNHGQPDAAQGEDHVEDHQVRYVDFLFYKNTIKDTGFGMRYNDLDHAGDDRTATSEQEPDLEKPHVHHTRLTLMDNVIDGSTLRVAILNAPDERHLPGQSAELTIQNNRVLAPSAGDGLVVQDVANAHVYIAGNRIEKGEMHLTGASGILLQRFRDSSIHIDGNTLGAYKYGIRASEFDINTTWAVGRNSAPGSEFPVFWDNSVPNPPDGATQADAQTHDHSDEAATPTALRRIWISG